MNKLIGLLGTCLLALTLVACGNGDGKGKDDADVIPDQETLADAPLPFNCEGRDGEPCDDGNPCHVGEGVCLAGDCFYEEAQKLVCDTPPNACSVSAGCADEACVWELAPGYCFIDEGCVDESTTKPGNACMICDPEENRGGWSPITGGSCTPEANECATTGQCQQGFCVPVADGQECASDADCLGKDDDDACNGIWVCQDCSCVYDPSTVVQCDDGEDTECVKAQCNPASGECEMVPQQDGTPCEDGNDCTAVDYCVGGECQSGQVAPPVWKPVKAVNAAYITAVTFHGTTSPVLYAVGSGGTVYRSADLGATFTQSDVLAPGGDLGDWLFVVGEGSPNILALFGKTLIVSNNGGITYDEKLQGCEALSQAATAPSTFVAVCNKQIQVSTDAGASWQAGGSVPVGGNAQVTALAAKDVHTFFVGSQGEDGQGRGHVYRTEDGGNGWSTIDPPDRPDLAYVAHRGLFISTKAPEKLFLGWATTTGNVFEFGQTPLFRSEDNGNSFTPLNATLQGASWVPVALDTIGRLLVGVDTTLARGGSYGTGPWGPIQKPNPPGNILFHTITNAVIQPGNDFSFFLPVGNGVALASELGTKWDLYAKGLNGPLFSRVATCEGGTDMYAVERFSSGLFRSSDGGVTWSQLTLPPGAEGIEVTSLVCSPGSGKGVYAFTSDGGLLFSTNGGQSFSFLDETNGPVLASNNALAGFPNAAGQVLVSRLGMGLFKTVDGGVPQGDGYEPLPLPDAYVASVAADRFDNGRFYVGTMATPESPRARVYLCTDFGESCSQKLQSDVVEVGAAHTEYRITVDPSVSGRVFAALTGDKAKVHVSTNSGESWQSFLDLPLLSTRGWDEVLADPDSKGSFFAALWLNGLYYYDQLGGEWLELAEASEGTAALAWDPASGDLLAGSGLSSKLYKSDDKGASWALAKDFAANDFHVRRLVSDGGYLFALLQSKTHNSTKLFVRDGAQWKESVIGTAINDVAVLEPENETVLAAGRFGGLYLSQDGGQNFAPFGSIEAGARDLEVSPSDPQVVYAAVDCGQLPAWYDPNQSFLGSDCGVKRSVDGGQSWFNVLNTGTACTRVVASADVPGLLYASCPDSGLYYSVDGGSSWTEAGGWAHLAEVNTLALGTGYLYAGTRSEGVARVSLNPDDGIYESWEGGLDSPLHTWKPVSGIRVELQPSNSSRVYVYAQPGGLYRTDDFGGSWRQVGDRLAPEPGTALPSQRQSAMVPRIVSTNQGEQLWVAVSGRGIFVSQDWGGHWLFASGSSAPVSSSHPVELLTHSDFPGNAWLATKEGFFRTSDQGGLWQKIETGLAKGAIEAAMGPVNNQIYVSLAGAGIHSVAYDGAAWTKGHAVNFHGAVSNAWSGRLLSLWHFADVDPDSDKTVLVGLDPNGLFRSQDGGISFQQIGTGLPAGRVLGLTRAPTNPDFLVAGTAQGPYGSTDRGETFAPLSDGPVNPAFCFSFAFDAADTSTLYALCANSLPHGESLADEENNYGTRKLYASYDKGVSWEQLGDGLANEKRPVAVLADPEEGGVLYVATLEGGIQRSVDGGLTFAPWSTGLPAPYTGGRHQLYSSPMTFDQDGEMAILGTEGFGFYTRVLAAECE